MLNYETLLSSYDDRLTLLEYLKKVEAALADASATSFSVTKTGDATIKFVLTFEDGSTLESGEIVLQQGESVASAAIAANGHLLLTLTNGDVLDAGNLFNGNVNITGTLSVSGDLTPSNLLIPTSGAIKGASAGQVEIKTDLPVVETMNGYAFTNPEASEKFTTNVTFAGVARNGNKLTFAVAFEITKLANSGSDFIYCRFNIPYDVGAKLFPHTLGWSNSVLTSLVVPCFSSLNTKVDLRVHVLKSAYTSIAVLVDSSSFNAFTDNTLYIGRAEFTFLLSENMAA